MTHGFALKNRFALAIFGSAFLSILTVVAFGYGGMNAYLRDSTQRSMEAIASSKHEALLAAHDGLIDRVRLIASRTRMRQLLQRYSLDGETARLGEVAKIVTDAASSVDAVVSVTIFDPDGQLLLQVPESLKRPTVDRSLESVVSGQPVLLGFVSGPRLRPHLSIAVPLMIDDQLVGKMLVEMRADDLLRITRDYTGLGKSGETIVARLTQANTAEFLVPTRHDPGAAFSRTVPGSRLDVPVTYAVTGQNRVFLDDIVDYRDVPVIAATRFVQPLGVGIVIKMDREEAFSGLAKLQKAIIGVCVLVVLFAVIVANMMARSITRPIYRLNRAISELSAGHFDSRVIAEAPGEVGALVDSFNNMVKQLGEASHQVQISEQQFRGAFDYTATGMALMTTDWQWIRVNPAIGEILGYQPDKLVEIPWAELPIVEDRDNDEKLIQRLLKGEINSYRVSKRFRSGPGQTIHGSMTVSAVRDEHGKPESLIMQLIDDTPRVKLEKRRNELVQSLQRSTQALEEFAHSASHDLLEPLRTLYKLGHFLEKGHADSLGDTGRDLVEQIQSNVKRMDTLIQSLLDYASIDRSSPELVATDMNKLVNDAIRALHARISDTKAEVEVLGDLPQTECDVGAVSHVFQNLISNGIKYNDSKPPKIQIGVRPGRDTVFYVRDNGIGIEERHQDTVFKVFKRLHGRDEFGGGTGAGLTISRRLVEWHGGELWFESVPGEGSTFLFRLSPPQGATATPGSVRVFAERS